MTTLTQVDDALDGAQTACNKSSYRKSADFKRFLLKIKGTSVLIRCSSTEFVKPSFLYSSKNDFAWASEPSVNLGISLVSMQTILVVVTIYALRVRSIDTTIYEQNMLINIGMTV